MKHLNLPLPAHFKPEKVGEVWRVEYQKRDDDALKWRQRFELRPAGEDDVRVALLLVDVQNTFCIPEFELFVGGRSGTGAVDDNRRLCEFIYRNLGVITRVFPTMDTHQPLQIFHSIFLVDENGRHPAPYTLISADEVAAGKWRVNPAAAEALGTDAQNMNSYLRHYAEALKRSGKFSLTVWPYHAMLGGIGHALVPAVEEAIFFHSIARTAQPDIQIKGQNPLTENYSAIGPEVLTGPDGEPIAKKNTALVENLLKFDAVIVAGQAKSHCVAWTVNDLLRETRQRDASAAGKFYLLDDCSSAVVVPGVIDYTEEAEAAYSRFAAAGMHRVSSTVPITDWLDFPG